MNMPLRITVFVLSALALFATVQAFYWVAEDDVPVVAPPQPTQSTPQEIDDDIRRCDFLCGGAVQSLKTGPGSFECICIEP
jgi:hypothetical protein